MLSFDELEKRHVRSPVQAVDEDASGVLVLARDQTEVVLSSSKEIWHRHANNGWYDLRLRTSSGDEVLLKNALSLSSLSFGFSRNAFEERIFPNIIVFKAQNICQDGRVRALSFTLSGMKHFFYYQHFEWIGLHKAKKSDLAVLKNMRRNDGDFFKPTDLYISHQTPQHLIKFKVGKCTYSVFSGISRIGPSWNKIDTAAHPIATINFGESVTIDEALDHLWAWKRFFHQVAMQPLSLDGIDVRSHARPVHVRANLYLPNLTWEKPDLHPGDIPLNRWKDRAQLGAAMQSWLSKDAERRVFRVALDRAIDKSRKRVSLDDIVTICSAVESLSELKETSKVNAEQISAMAAAAEVVALEHKIEVTPARIKDLLGLLQYQSLPRRLTLLGRSLDPDISRHDTELVMKVAVNLRNIAAHGQAIPEIIMPKVAPAVQALLSFCVLYDLRTCLVPVIANEHSHIIAMQKAHEAITRLKELKIK